MAANVHLECLAILGREIRGLAFFIKQSKVLAMALAGVAFSPSMCARAQQNLFEEARRSQASGDYPSAERLYRSFLSAHPKSVPALTNLGVVLAHEGDLRAAIATYNSALSIDSHVQPAMINRGLAYYRMRDWRNAAADFEEVVRSNPDDRRSRQLLAISLSQTGNYSASATEYERLMPTDDASILIGLATCYKETKREVESERILASLLASQGDSPQVYYLLGLAAYVREDYAKAIESLNKSLKINPGMVEARFYLGAAFFKQKSFQAALDQWIRVSKSDPTYFPALFCAGALLVDLESTREAQPLLERAYALNGHDAATQIALGKDYLDSHLPAKALPLFQSATRLKPESQPASFLLARTLKQLGRNQEAAEEFKRCHALFNTRVDVLGEPLDAAQPDGP